jgi:hypothetical protein
METTSFILGIGSVALFALVSLVIYNTIKVYKMQKELERLNRDHWDAYNNFHRLLETSTQSIYNVISEDRREIFNRFDKLELSKKK